MSQQINLFNPAFEQERQIFSAATMAQALVLLLAGVTALGFYGSARVAAMRKEADAGARMLVKKQARLTDVAREFAPRGRSPALDAELADAQARLATLERIGGVLERGELGDTHGYSEYFKALARQHVDGLWLTAVSIGAGGNDIGVQGRVLDPALLPGYLAQLTHEKALQGKAFGSLRIHPPAQAKARAEAKAEADAQQPAGPPPFVEFSLQSAPEGSPP